MSSPLENCAVVLSGVFLNYKHGDIKEMIEENGGKCSAKVTHATTHLVATTKDWDSKSAKVKQAQGYGLPILSMEWLLESDEAKYKQDESEYLFSSIIASDTERDDQENGKVKKHDRAAKVKDESPEVEDEEENDRAKKRGRALKVKDESPEVKDEEGNDKAKKRGRAPKVKDESLKVEDDVKNEDDEYPPAKRQKDGQKARSKNVNIPVDEGCPLQGSHRVYIDSDGTIFDAALNQTNAGSNANKFYRIQILHSLSGNYQTWTRWGRVGERGQSALLGDGSLDDAQKQFAKKFKDKTGHTLENRLDPPKKGKYTFVERNYESDSSDEDNDQLPGDEGRRGSKASTGSPIKKESVKSTLTLPVQALMRFIFNQDFFAANMASMSYDSNKLPLGKLSKRTLKQGYEALKRLAELFANPALAQQEHNMSYADAVTDCSNAFYTTIPHSFGRNRPPIINNDDMLKKEIALLESLSDMRVAEELMKDARDDGADVIHPLDRQYQGLNMNEMTPLDHSSPEFQALESYLLKTHGKTHCMSFTIEEIFRIDRAGESIRFTQSPYATLTGDRRLLWHGSRSTNFGGILSQGLRIAPPEAPVSGYMFGKGVYLADISSKSAGYCAPVLSGGVGLLLLCEAELGKPMLELTDADYNAEEEARKKGCYATWGRGLTVPAGWMDAGCVSEELKGVLMPDTKEPPKESGIENAYLAYNEYIVYDVAQLRLRYLFRVKIT